MKKLFLICVLVSTMAWADSARQPIAGPESAPLTIQVFSDFTCPYCAKGNKLVEQILKNYPQDVKIVFRNMPLDMHGSTADTAARAFAAVYLQDPTLAYQFQNRLFQRQDDYDKKGEKLLFEIADKLKVNISQMKEDMKGKEVAQIISEDKALVKELNITGTPAFMIGKKLVVGSYPFAEMKLNIDQQLHQSQ